MTKTESKHQFLDKESRSYFSQQDRKKSVQMPSISTNQRMLDGPHSASIFHSKKKSVQATNRTGVTGPPDLSTPSKNADNIASTNFSQKTPKRAGGSALGREEILHTSTQQETVNASAEKTTNPEEVVLEESNAEFFRRTSPA